LERSSETGEIEEMIDPEHFRDLDPKTGSPVYNADHVSSGIPIPKTKRIELFSPVEWEEFTEEWGLSLKSDYQSVRRFAGSGDKGLDVVGFVVGNTFEGGWDNYQCKHYDHPLYPSDVWIEIGKIIFYSYSGEYPAPRKHYFIGSKGIGTSLAKLLAAPQKLKSEVRKNWAGYCEKSISDRIDLPLSEDLLTYFEDFDFGIFSSKTLAELIDGHTRTPFHSVRFGGGLPLRPASKKPPQKISPSESRYVQQIFEAYADHVGEPINDVSALSSRPVLEHDFLRQRERFYQAESLRNFARDTVPEGTFEDLQEDVFQGVVDVCESDHADGLARMRATLAQSAQLVVASSPLSSVTKSRDKQGICHQLANDDRLIWVQEIENV
jgi:hypothetical protein